MHPDIDQIFSDIRANEAALAEITRGLSTEELLWQPKPGAWSILQCVDHLAMAHGSYLGAMQPVVKAGKAAGQLRRGPVQPSLPGRLFLKRLEPPITGKVPAPKSILPGSRLDPESVLASLSRAHDEIRKLLQEAAELDCNAIRFRNPLIRALRVRVGTAFLILNAHERRHLWQADNVRKAMRASA